MAGYLAIPNATSFTLANNGDKPVYINLREDWLGKPAFEVLLRPGVEITLPK